MICHLVLMSPTWVVQEAERPEICPDDWDNTWRFQTAADISHVGHGSEMIGVALGSGV